MIVDAWLWWAVTLIEFITGLIPEWETPAWFATGRDFFGQIFEVGNSMGAWVPIGLTFGIAAAVLIAVIVGLAVRVVRIAASFFTAGGGSAG